MQQPTIGRIVHYTLTEQDAEQINRRREDFTNRPSGPGHEGFQAHVGNRAEAGQTFPAEVVRCFGDAVNLQVSLDGTDTYWATSRTEGEPNEQGRWIWPPRL
jgi:hypothetical protein